MKELIFAHDSCRIVECMVTNGGSDVRNALFEELVPEIIRMTKSKYARFFIIKMLKHGYDFNKLFLMEIKNIKSFLVILNKLILGKIKNLERW